MIKNIIRFFFGGLIISIKGKRLIKKYINQGKFYIVTSHGLGDIVWMSAFLHSYIQGNNISFDKVVIITLEKLSRIINSFGYSYEYCFVSKDELSQFHNYLSRHNHKNIKLAIFPLAKPNKKAIKEFAYLSTIGAEMDSLYKNACFSLTNDNIALPISKNKSSSRIPKVIFIPFVNSRNLIPLSCWEEIAKMFTNCDLYTNTINDDEIIKGTKKLDISLDELDGFINKNDLVISARCGLGDWIFALQKNMIVLHSITAGTDQLEQARSNFAKWESFSRIKNEYAEFGDFFVKDVRVDLSNNKDSALSMIRSNIKDFFDYIKEDQPNEK